MANRGLLPAMPAHAAAILSTHPAPINWSKRISEIGPIKVRLRRCWRMISWPAAKGISASSASPVATEEPSGTYCATASFIEVILLMLVRTPQLYRHNHLTRKYYHFYQR